MLLGARAPGLGRDDGIDRLAGQRLDAVRIAQVDDLHRIEGEAALLQHLGEHVIEVDALGAAGHLQTFEVLE